jgi:DNA-binding HxlR family transcriptional regulator
MMTCVRFKPSGDVMIHEPRSSCPINRCLEALGDQWSLLILRDIALHDRRSFREILSGNAEHISAPVLSRRLTDLTTSGFLTKVNAPRGKQGKYSLTDLGLATVPLLVELSRLGGLIDSTTQDADGLLVMDDSEIEERTEALRARHLGSAGE